MKLYSIRDLKADAFAAPWVAANDYVAVRMVMDSMDDGKSMLSRHPEDYELWQVGDWNERTGVISPYRELRTSIVGLTLVEETPHG